MHKKMRKRCIIFHKGQEVISIILILSILLS